MFNPPTQQQRILDLLRQRSWEGVYVYEIMAPRPSGLGVAQYNARIKELREQGFNIINKTPGHFVLEEKKIIKEDWRAEKRLARLKEMEEEGQGNLL